MGSYCKRDSKGRGIGCSLFIVSMVISCTALTIQHFKDVKRKEETSRIKKEKIDYFFSHFDKYSHTPFLSSIEIFEMVNGDYDIYSNIHKGDVFIVDVNSPFLKFDSTSNSYNTSKGLNKINITITRPNKRANVESRTYTLAYVDDVSSKSYDGGCFVKRKDLLNFLEDDIIEGSDKLLKIIKGEK